MQRCEQEGSLPSIVNKYFLSVGYAHPSAGAAQRRRWAIAATQQGQLGNSNWAVERGSCAVMSGKGHDT